MAELPEDGKATLYDGRTGELLSCSYWLYVYSKLAHLVDDKIHARLQVHILLLPFIGGKAQFEVRDLVKWKWA